MELTIERLRDLLSYNKDTGIFIWNKATGKRTDLIGKVAGLERDKGNGKKYWMIRIDTKMYSCGRLAWFYVNGAWPNNCIDHINGDSLYNRYNNLRDVTRKQNQQNIYSRVKKSKLPLGVTKRNDRFIASIHINGIKKHLGIYDTKEDAYTVYVEARRKYFDQFNSL